MNLVYLKDYRNAVMIKLALLAGAIGAVGLVYVDQRPDPVHEPVRSTAPFMTPTEDTAAVAPAHQLLQQVYQRQAALTQWGADLTIKVTDEATTSVKEGKVAVMQDQYRLETEEEKIVSNGKTLWVYTRKDGHLQIAEATPDASNFFCYPTQLMQRYQQYCRVEEQPAQDANQRIITFVATDNRAPFTRMEVQINPHQYQIEKIAVWETANIGYSIIINALYTNAQFDPLLFEFDERLVDQSRIKDFR